MLSNANVLAEFGNWLSPGDISRILTRLLRIPEAWDQLHNPDFITLLLNKKIEQNLLLSNLFRLQNQLSAQSATHFSSLEELDVKLMDLVGYIEGLSSAEIGFQHTAILTEYVIKYLSSDHETVLERITRDPQKWRSAVACAWSEIGDLSILPTTLLHSDNEEVVLLVVNALLANLGMDEAAKTLLTLSGGSLPRNLFPLVSSRDPIFVQKVIEIAASENLLFSGSAPGQSFESMLLKAYVARQNHEYDTAREILHDAQETSGRFNASISDQCAEIARVMKQQTLELESRENANRYESTPQRRASLAHLLLEMDRLDEAQKVLDHDSEFIEEKIVNGIILSEQDLMDLAKDSFIKAAENLKTQYLQDFGWTEVLIDKLTSLDEYGAAIEVAMVRDQTLGADVQNKVNYSRFLLEAGDPISAADSAHIAYAISPQSNEGREVLAMALHESGLAAEALAHWNVLSQTDNSAILRVAQCALEAGFIDLAIHTADGLLANEALSNGAQIVIGQAHRIKGDLKGAREYFEQVVEESPNNTKAWIALAECLEASGDREGAGQVLVRAIQTNPSDAHLLHAQALWLENEGRLSEALEAVENAHGLDPKSIDVQVTFGDLLRRLGHHEKSLGVLENAVSRKPFQWKGLKSLAQALADIGNHDAALSTITKLPKSAPPEAHFIAGQIVVRAAHQSKDMNLASKGIEHLQLALDRGFEDQRLNHWFGLARETMGEFDKAFDAYQASLKSLPSAEYDLLLDSKVGLGRSALAIGQSTIAISLLEDAQKRDQRSTAVLVALSEAYLQSGKKAKAFDAAERALDIDPADHSAVEQITRIASETNNWASAMHALKKLVDVRPLDPCSWITYAESATRAKNIPEARKALAQALRHARMEPATLVGVARVMAKLELPYSAIRCIQRALKIEPDNVFHLRELALAAEAVGDKATAQRAWSRCVELDPNDTTTLEKAAQAHWNLGLRAGALSLWERAHSVDSKHVDVLIKLCSAYFAQGDSITGQQYLNKLVRIDPDDIDLILYSARLAIDLGEAAFAANLLGGILRSAPTRNDVLLTLAESFLKMDEHHKAREVLKSIILEPMPPSCWIAISALTALQVGNDRKAMSFYNAGRSQDEITARDSILMAEAALGLGKWDEALIWVDQNSIEPEPWQLNLARANVRIRIEELMEIYNHADTVRHNPSNTLLNGKNNRTSENFIDLARIDFAPKLASEALNIRKALLSRPLDNTLWNDALLSLQSNPSSDILEALSIASMRCGKNQETIETVALRDDLGIESDWLDIIAGLSQHALGQYSAAHKSFQRGENNPSIRPISKYLSSKSLIELEAESAAIEHLSAALNIWPEEEVWQYQLGTLYLNTGNLDAALPRLQEASELSPSNSEYRLALAKGLKESGHLSLAYKYYQIAVEQSPSDGQLWLEAAHLAFGMGELSEAEQYYEKACELLPAEPGAFTGAARTALALCNTKSAMKKVRTAMQLAPEEPDVLVTVGEILAQQGKTEKALKNFELAILKIKDPLPLRIARARLLIKANQTAKAIEEMQALTDLYPENEELWAVYGEICEQTDNLAEGIEAANRAAKLAPNNPVYHLLLARLSRKAGQLDRALDELTKLEQKNPSNSKVLTELGLLYEDRRQYTEALDAYQRAIACNGNSSIPYLHAGVVLKHLKFYPQAGEMLRKAVDLNPQDPEALHQLAAVRALELVHGGIREMAVTI